MGKCYLELRYEVGDRDIPLATIDQPRMLVFIKAYLLARQEQVARKARQMDELLGVSEEEEFTRLRKVLDMAIPGEVDVSRILDGINGNGNGQKG